MEHFVIIHQKKGRDLYDYYPTEDAAKAAFQAISDAVHLSTGSVVTPSGKVAFEVANYAGAEYNIEAPTSKATNRARVIVRTGSYRTDERRRLGVRERGSAGRDVVHRLHVYSDRDAAAASVFDTLCG